MDAYLVFHIHHLLTDEHGDISHIDEDGEISVDENEDDVKIIGIFSSQDKANTAINQLKGKPGFRDEPNCFMIDKYEVDEIKWEEGYETHYT